MKTITFEIESEGAEGVTIEIASENGLMFFNAGADAAANWSRQIEVSGESLGLGLSQCVKPTQRCDCPR